MNLIVTGMPRSGTSLLCGILDRLGVDFGPSFRADEFAPTGYFENREIIDFNRLVVKRLCGDNILPGHQRAIDHPDWDEWLHKARAYVAERPALKLPRMPLVSPLWEQAAPDATLIVCVRHPEEIALSWERTYRVPPDETLSVYVYYYSRLLTLPALFVAYDRWFTEPADQLARVCEHVGIEPDPAALDIKGDEHRHYVSDGPHWLHDLLVARCE